MSVVTWEAGRLLAPPAADPQWRRRRPRCRHALDEPLATRGSKQGERRPKSWRASGAGQPPQFARAPNDSDSPAGNQTGDRARGNRHGPSPGGLPPTVHQRDSVSATPAGTPARTRAPTKRCSRLLSPAQPPSENDTERRRRDARRCPDRAVRIDTRHMGVMRRVQRSVGARALLGRQWRQTLSVGFRAVDGATPA